MFMYVLTSACDTRSPHASLSTHTYTYSNKLTLTHHTPSPSHPPPTPPTTHHPSHSWGIWGDWDTPYLTLSPAYEAAQLSVFGRMVFNGHIYRGRKPVHWSPSSGTALAEAELEYPEGHTSQSIYVAMPLVTVGEAAGNAKGGSEKGGDGQGDGQGVDLATALQGACFAIWTTTPWTIPANLAVAVNDALEYAVVEATVCGNLRGLGMVKYVCVCVCLCCCVCIVSVCIVSVCMLMFCMCIRTWCVYQVCVYPPNIHPPSLHSTIHPKTHNQGDATSTWSHKKLIVAADLVQPLEEKFGVTLRTLCTTPGAALEGCTYQHPLVDRTSPVVIGGDYITTESGTGLVHTAPGHGQEDYQVGQRYGLPLLSPVDDEGVFTAEAGVFEGLSVLGEGNTAVIGALREAGALLREEGYVHKYPYDWRTKKPTIFRATDQVWCGGGGHGCTRTRRK